MQALITFPRRELLQKLASTALLFFVPRPQLLSCQPPKPEFWFGDTVDFRWEDETTGKVQSETGEVIGVNWDFTAEEWEYRIMWTGSTAYPDDYYPMCDGQLVTAGVICKH
jgi:hypothetical protein